MSWVVLCDFDGTITKLDTAEYALSKFAQGDWKSVERRFEMGEITLEEALKQEFSLVRATKRQILDELDEVVTFRPGFEEFAKYCRSRHFPVMIVSAGLDFVIKHYLRLKGWAGLAEIYMARTRLTEDGIQLIFPKPIDGRSANFKHDLARRFKSQGKRIIYIGDGTGDYAAAREASVFFVVRGSRLEQLCRENRDNCMSMTDFREVTGYFKERFLR